MNILDEFNSLASSLAVPGGVVSAVALILYTLIRTRSTDRAELSKDQQEHMDRLARERNEANRRADDYMRRLDREAAEKASALARAATAEALNIRLQGQIEELSAKVEALTGEVQALRVSLNVT